MKFDDICNAILERVFHGTPHDIVGTFDLQKIGSGEGAQAYGWGLYFAESPKVAEEYRDRSYFYKVNGKATRVPHWEDVENDIVTPEEIAVKVVHSLPEYEMYSKMENDRRQFPNEEKTMKAIEILKQNGVQEVGEGNLYEVNILADKENDFLDWDKPINQQSKKVLGLLKSLASELESEDSFWDRDLQALEVIKSGKGKPLTGMDVYSDIQSALESQDSKAASEKLLSVGIKGIRYLDQGSRGTGEGTYNYVVFDPKIIQIVAQNGEFVMPSKKPEMVEV